MCFGVVWWEVGWSEMAQRINRFYIALMTTAPAAAPTSKDGIENARLLPSDVRDTGKKNITTAPTIKATNVMSHGVDSCSQPPTDGG